MVRDPATRRLFALKTIHKKMLVEKNAAVRTASLLSEKHALELFCHPFITSLTSHYQDAAYLYLLMELAIGGDLFGVMDRQEHLPESAARFYTSSLTLALQHIHQLEFVYRDLKPENILLDGRGYIKLCDFGFAKKIALERTFTQCGTPDYVAPEMLMGQGVNQACDWWALGVLLYEMVRGHPPFTDASGEDMKTFANILKGEIDFEGSGEDAKFTEEARELIGSLLTVKVASRLGYINGGAESVIKHPWFATLDWDQLVNLTLDAPWKPAVRFRAESIRVPHTCSLHTYLTPAACKPAHLPHTRSLHTLHTLRLVGVTLPNVSFESRWRQLRAADDTQFFDNEAEASTFASDALLSDKDNATWAHVWAAFGDYQPHPSCSSGIVEAVAAGAVGSFGGDATPSTPVTVSEAAVSAAGGEEGKGDNSGALPRDKGTTTTSQEGKRAP